MLALFFGGARAAIRVMQGKPAATEPEFLRIDLSGSAAGSSGRIRGQAAGVTPDCALVVVQEPGLSG